MVQVMKRTDGRMGQKNWFIVGSLGFLLAYALLIKLDPAARGVLYWLAAGFAFAAFALSFLWMRSLDELALNAHIQSWFWGGALALALFAGLLFALGPHLNTFVEAALTSWRGRATPTGGFLLGASIPLAMQGVLATIWWAAFWMRRR